MLRFAVGREQGDELVAVARSHLGGERAAARALLPVGRHDGVVDVQQRLSLDVGVAVPGEGER
eukprot:scaffold33238_cov63-Phaeocystis_antarctica.AAC.4